MKKEEIRDALIKEHGVAEERIKDLNYAELRSLLSDFKKAEREERFSDEDGAIMFPNGWDPDESNEDHF